MLEIALYEAKNKLSGLLDEVAAGKSITITRHGKAAARLVPVDQGFDRAKAMQAAKTLFEIRKGVTLGDMPIKELINEGRP
ncbi:MAG: type II toxin-antitoxin system prevent-host-death family antitoxin [Deltaproteobacteria bacterium]|jgi:prevent-host-death family protein|nr:type II toxin-antitoxin system prevent-host-death family antitoxin [Deltaproteobacteria bacterium]